MSRKHLGSCCWAQYPETYNCDSRCWDAPGSQWPCKNRPAISLLYLQMVFMQQGFVSCPAVPWMELLRITMFWIWVCSQDLWCQLVNSSLGAGGDGYWIHYSLIPLSHTHALTKRDYNQITPFTTLAIGTATVGNSMTVSNPSSWEGSRQTNGQFRCSVTLCIRVLMFITAHLLLGRLRRRICQIEAGGTWGKQLHSYASANSAVWVRM